MGNTLDKWYTPEKRTFTLEVTDAELRCLIQLLREAVHAGTARRQSGSPTHPTT